MHQPRQELGTLTPAGFNLVRRVLVAIGAVLALATSAAVAHADTKESVPLPMEVESDSGSGFRARLEASTEANTYSSTTSAVWNCTVGVDPPVLTITSGGVRYVNGDGGQVCSGTYQSQYSCVEVERFDAGTGLWIDQPNGAGALSSCSAQTAASTTTVRHQVACGPAGSTFTFRATATGYVLADGLWVSSLPYSSPSRYTTC